MKKFIFFGLVAAMLLALSSCGNNAEIEALRQDVDAIKSELSTLNKQGNIPSSSTLKSSDNSDAAYTLTAGDYEIPIDVAEGKYDVVCVAGDGVFNVHDPENGYVISEIMDITDEDSVKERKNAHLVSGQNINITGTLKVILIAK